MTDDPRRGLPSVDRLLREMAAGSNDRLPAPAWACREAARQALDEARKRLGAGQEPGDVAQRARALAVSLAHQRPQRVVNATGVVLHTNLGRSALPAGAARAAAEAAAAYSDLELDLDSGARGNRLAPVSELLRLLSGAEAALAVNNAAAAVLLAVQALASGREVVVSRGELVEIGGSFRVPDILVQAGVRLVEVGTTNRTHAADYRAAIGPDTALLLKVHRSNFEQRGFVAEVGLAELVEIGRDQGVPVVEDLGSGSLFDLRPRGLPDETFAPARLATGADLVCFSGDKLLGGPQAGLILGRRDAVERLRRCPLARALRLDKLSLAALDWTLRALLDGRTDEIPTLRMLLQEPVVVRERAEELARRLRKAAAGALEVSVEESHAPVGGGSAPGFGLPSFAVVLAGPAPPDLLAGALRRATPPVLGRVQDERLSLDAFALLPGDDAAIESAVAGLVSQMPDLTRV